MPSTSTIYTLYTSHQRRQDCLTQYPAHNAENKNAQARTSGSDNGEYHDETPRSSDEAVLLSVVLLLLVSRPKGRPW